MADVFTKHKRSLVMSKIGGSGNKDTELRMISLFRASGRWWRETTEFYREGR